MLAEAEGRFFAFVDEEMIGPFDTFLEAYGAAMRSFGIVPMYIKQVVAIEPPPEVMAIESCLF